MSSFLNCVSPSWWFGTTWREMGKCDVWPSLSSLIFQSIFWYVTDLTLREGEGISLAQWPKFWIWELFVCHDFTVHLYNGSDQRQVLSNDLLPKNQSWISKGNWTRSISHGFTFPDSVSVVWLPSQLAPRSLHSLGHPCVTTPSGHLFFKLHHLLPLFFSSIPTAWKPVQNGHHSFLLLFYF